MYAKKPYRGFYLIPYGACYLTTKLGEFYSPLVDIAYSGIYAGLTHQRTKNPKFTEHLHKARLVFAWVDMGFTVWSVGKLLNTLDRKYPILKLSSLNQWTPGRCFAFGLVNYAVMGVWIAAGIYAVNKINRYARSAGDPKKILTDHLTEGNEEQKIKN
jgi:hypothetical protein